MRIGLPVKLLLSYLLVGLALALPPFVVLRQSLITSLEANEGRALLERAHALSDSLRDVAPSLLSTEVRRYARLLGDRVTVVNAAGAVIADSDLVDSQLSQAENHRNRPEIAAAIASGEGVATRMSASLQVDLLYAAVRMDVGAPPERVLRLAEPRSAIAEKVSGALRAMRVSIGVGLSLALLLSLVAAYFVALPLRKMRWVAQEFGRSNWVEVPRYRTGDELQDLSQALDELGHRLRLQLVSLGTAEALLRRVIEVLPFPTGLFNAETRVGSLGPTLRSRLQLFPEVEERFFFELAEGLAISSGITAPGPVRIHTEAAHADIRAYPLGSGPKLGTWLLLAELPPEPWPVESRELERADGMLGALWDELPEQRQRLAPLRELLDGWRLDFPVPTSMHFSPVAASALLGRSLAQAVPSPAEAARIRLGPVPEVTVSETDGACAWAIRMLVRGTVAANPGDRALEFECRSLGTQLELRVSAAPPVALEKLARVAQALGGDAGVDASLQPPSTWLTLPRA